MAQMTGLKGEGRVPGDKAVLFRSKSLILFLSHSSESLDKFLDITSKASHGTVHSRLCDLARTNATYSYIRTVPLALCAFVCRALLMCASVPLHVHFLSVECFSPHCFSCVSQIMLSNTSVKLG